MCDGRFEPLRESLRELQRLAHTVLLCAFVDDSVHEHIDETSGRASSVAAEIRPLVEPNAEVADSASESTDELRQDCMSFAASLARLLTVDVVSLDFRQELRRFACEMEALTNASIEVMTLARGPGPSPPSGGDSAPESRHGELLPTDSWLVLLSDAAQKTELAKQVLEVALAKWIGVQTDVLSGAGGRIRR